MAGFFANTSLAISKQVHRDEIRAISGSTPVKFPRLNEFIRSIRRLNFREDNNSVLTAEELFYRIFLRLGNRESMAFR